MNNISYIIIACYPDKGMKSYGSKALMLFNNQRLLDYQIANIHKSQNKKHNYEIIVLCDFDTQKISKLYSSKARIIDLDDQNPIYRGAQQAKYKNLLFIDYGCVFEYSVIKNISIDKSSIMCAQNYKSNKLDIGCIIDEKNKTLQHMFFDLPENKFCNIFFISSNDANKIVDNEDYHPNNLLYFEIINKLKSDGSDINIINIPSNKFLYFNNMRQKYGISKFIKNSTN